jgi:dTDP-4-amino-4,6-dideoxygalactose transaminase
MSQLAILGGPRACPGPMPRWPVHGPREEALLAEVLGSGNWGGFPFPNEKAREFGALFAKAQGARHALVVTNGTVALEVALRAVGIGRGDEVIVPAYTWEGTAAAVMAAGGVPVFADCDPETYCLDPASLDAALSARTRAVLPVHLGMSMADMDAIIAFAGRRGLAVIEDCAHAHGARWKGRGAGSLGDAGCFSFQTSKLMTAGEGGAIVTSRDDVEERCETISNCGRASEADRHGWRGVGGNSRMTEFQAAVLIAQLERLEEQTARREAALARLEAALAGVPGLRPLRRDPRQDRRAIYQLVLRYDPEAFAGASRDAFAAALEAEGVPADGTFYEAVYRSPLFLAPPGSFRALPCPVTERAAYREAVWIPHWVLLGDDRVFDGVFEAIRKVREHAGELAGLDHPAIRAKGMNRAERDRLLRRSW